MDIGRFFSRVGFLGPLLGAFIAVSPGNGSEVLASEPHDHGGMSADLGFDIELLTHNPVERAPLGCPTPFGRAVRVESPIFPLGNGELRTSAEIADRGSPRSIGVRTISVALLDDWVERAPAPGLAPAPQQAQQASAPPFRPVGGYPELNGRWNVTGMTCAGEAPNEGTLGLYTGGNSIALRIDGPKGAFVDVINGCQKTMPLALLYREPNRLSASFSGPIQCVPAGCDPACGVHPPVTVDYVYALRDGKLELESLGGVDTNCSDHGQGNPIHYRMER